MEKKSFKLYVCNFFPESLFINTYGKDVYNQIISTIPNKSKCASCGHEPKYTETNKALSPHIYHIDKNNILNSKATMLCKACHATQHIEIALKNNWVKFVNSSLSQSNLIIASRYGDLKKLYLENKIIDLKKDTQTVLEEIKKGTFKTSPTLKVVFTKKFIFNDL